MAVCNANTLLESAKCFQCLSKKELQMVIAQLLCDINASGGGGGGGQDAILTAEVWAAAGVPTHTPTIDRQIYTDTNTGAQWYWYLNTWTH